MASTPESKTSGFAPTDQVEMPRTRPKDMQDNFALSRLGKKPVLKRNFGLMSILGFSCTVLITWEGVLTLFNIGLSNGGPAGIVYGYLVAWIGTFSNFVVLSEMASMAPVSSGQYHWVAMLSPRKWQRFLSYTTGWLTVLGWQALVATATILTAALFQGLIILCNESTYTPQLWHTTLIYWAILIFAMIINTVVSGLLPRFESFIFILHVAGFFAIMIPLVYFGKHGSAQDVFETFVNAGGWPSQGLSFWVGIVGNVLAFFGADGAFHMSEEIHNAQIMVPRSILTAIILNGILGFGMTLSILFYLEDVDAVLATPTGYPFVEVFRQAVQSTAGAAVMASVVGVLTIATIVGVLASASRILWAFSRDKVVPGWRFLQAVDSRTLIPLRAVATTLVINVLLGLINIGSAVVFRHILSLTIAAIYASYLIATSLFLWRRCREDIAPFDHTSTTLTNVPGAPLSWGPWALPKWFGIANNVFSCAYLLIIFFFSFWPAVTPVEPAAMNYSCLMFGAVMIFSTVYYFVWAHKTYTGPVVEVELS